jgi:hypothetical protein
MESIDRNLVTIRQRIAGFDPEPRDTVPAEAPGGFASPPCQRHEIDPNYAADTHENQSSPEPLK